VSSVGVWRSGTLRFGKRVGVVALALAALFVMAMPAAWAIGGKPVLVERWDDRFVEEPDFIVLEVCGVEVRTEFRFKGSFTLYEDGSAKVHENVDIVSSDPTSGEILLIERNTINVFSEPVVEIVDEDAGTLTLVFDDTFVGLPLRWMVPGQGVLIRDAGIVTLESTVVLDLETGEEISFEQATPDVRGPHPFLDLSDVEAMSIFCGAMSG
jgi:hypothetical protein